MSQKQQRRLSKNASIYRTFAIIAILIISIWAVSIFFRIVEIQVSGASYYSKEDIISVSGIMLGNSLLFIDPQYAQNNIMQQKPIVHEVRVERAPPHRVIIQVFESRPIAVVEHENSFLIIDSSARVMEISPVAPQGLVEIRGFIAENPAEGQVMTPYDGVQSRLGILAEVLSAMETTGICDMVSYLDVTSIARVFFDYGMVSVMLGAPDRVEVKLGSIEEFLYDRDICPLTTAGRIDMSHRSEWFWNAE